VSIQITAQSYHLRYLAEEDRVLFSVDVAQGQEIGIALTRRFTRNFLAAFAKFVSERVRLEAKHDSAARDAILDMEHNRSVADAIAKGSMREGPQPPAFPIPTPKLVQEAKFVSNERGGLALVFLNSEHRLVLEVGPGRIHMVLETFVKIAERAGWDFPPIASWLDPAKSAGSNAGKTVN
jgi:hypothetical protein